MRGMTVAFLLALVLLKPVVQEPAPAEAPAAPAPAPSSSSYTIGAEDVLRIVVYGHDDLTQTVVIEPDGSFVFPLLGRMAAAGLTPRELEQSLVARLGEGYVRRPQVAVVVQTYRSHVVYVVGEVAKPGSVPLPDARTLVEVLARVGPLLPLAGAEVIVLRPRPGAAAADAAEVIRVSLSRLQAGALENNVVLQPNDTVLVPRMARVYVSGAVKRPGVFPLTTGLTVRQAISLAGGFEHRGRRSVRIVRTVDERSEQLKAELDDALRADDTIVVGERF
jgi:polysaccharide biosynthesis/export protein